MDEYETEAEWFAKENLFNKKESDGYFGYFIKQCLGKRTCTIDANKLNMTKRCKDKYDNKDATLMLVALCKTSAVDLAVGYGDKTYAERTISKDDFSIIILITDFLIVILFIIFYNRL